MVELYVNGNRIELQEQELGIRITKSVNNVLFPSKRQGSYSNDIQAPRTKNNDKTLEHIYNLQTVSNFKNKQNIALLKDKGTVVMSGFIRINEMTSGFYSLTVYADNADWFEKLKGVYLKDVINKKYYYSISNIFSSWTKNSFNSTIVFPYLQINGSIAESQYLKNFIPFFYCRRLLKDVFKHIGYIFNEKFFTTPEVSEMILSGTQKRLRASNAYNIANISNAQGTWVTGSPDLNEYKLQTFQDQVFFLDLTQTNNAVLWSMAQDCYYPPQTGRYRIKGYIKINLQYNGASDINETYTLALGSNNFNKKVVQSSMTIELKDHNGSAISWDKKMYIDEECDLEFGDFIVPYLERQTVEHRAQLRFIDFIFDAIPLDLELPYDSYINEKEIAPDMKAQDFISSIINTFNIVVEEADGEVIMLPSDEYYLPPTEQEDWTDKIDLSKDFIQTPLSQKFGKNLLFKHNQTDLDSWNSTGTKEGLEELINRYGDGGKVNEDLNTTDETTIAETKFITPKTTRYTELVGQINWNMINSSVKIERDSGYYPYVMIKGKQVSGTIGLINYPSSAINVYPYYLHVYTSSIQSSNNLSLLFANKLDYGFSYSTIGLIDRYYTNTIRRINEGYFIECSVKLNEVDIANLSFRKPKMISTPYGKMLCILNRVVEYDLTNKEVTKCEFITY